MSDAEENTFEIAAPESQETEALETTEGQENQEAESSGQKGYVEFSPEQQERFNDVYKQARASDEANQLLRQEREDFVAAMEGYNSQLQQMQQRIAMYETGQITGKAEDRLGELESQIIQAQEVGNYKEAFNLQNQYFQIQNELGKVKQTVRQPHLQPVQITPQQEQAVGQWATERDQEGNLRRPWAQQNNELFNETIAEAEKLAKIYGNAKPTEFMLSELDKRMAQKARAKQPAQVLPKSANLTNTKLPAKLTQDEEFVAKRLGYSDKTKYAKAAALVKAGKGRLVVNPDKSREWMAPRGEA